MSLVTVLIGRAGQRVSNGGVMNCLMCKQAEPRPNLTTVTLERDEFTLTIQNVPALVCPHCGEAYTDEATATHLLKTAEQMEYSGLLMDVRSFTTE